MKEVAEQPAETEQNEGEAGAAPKRGRPAKEAPAPKLWRVVGQSPEGLSVTLGRYTTKEEAEPELVRMRSEGFYEKLKITHSKEVV